ncbi:hypothetical protein BAUCODRAFT_65608 [Baudoinia panamericana UAMH 10762]|uniref:FAD-binding domain-containing protein n=1 Tax=Baudoinia panamericana (strain UAMH 10762) TaxID=717646 RepID=M2N530_BAUPA|nr:uncharacterized protein BAUCODRAFT_65608 [Baudoinia panamericana UAMH 10762]EMC99103.1 hypothetical protein BAUCODRAFT_65608 [Baudoinia panamericana UAMH 10762]
MNVLIIGAGSTGLLLAQGLKQVRSPLLPANVTVCERDSHERYHGRPRDWGMTLHWGHKLLRQMLSPDLRQRIHEAVCNPHRGRDSEELVHYAGHTGEVLFRTPVTDAVRVSRRKLRMLLSEGIDIRFGKLLRSIVKTDSNVVASFEDGDHIEADLIVGCDGAHSRVRAQLLGEEAATAKLLDVYMFNFIARYDADTARMLWENHPVFFNSVHPNRSFFWLSTQEVPDLERPETWTFQNLLVWRGAPTPSDLKTQELRSSYFRSQADAFAEPWKTVFKSLPENANLDIDTVSIWKPIRWSDSSLAGRVTLAGDAAHAMSPHRGQGLNAAFEDAALLTQLLSNAEQCPQAWQAAVNAYDEEMRPRGLREVQISESMVQMFHDWDNVVG